jgi:RHS repeat-associated protein
MDQGSTQLPAAGISTSYTQVLVESANGTVTRTYLPGLQVIAQKVNGSGAVAIPGDATGDGSVDAFDLNVMASHWQAPTTGTDAEKFAQGDFNLDGMVDAFDLNVLAANWGKSGTGLQVLLADGGGSTRVLSGAGGGTLETYGYDAYGTLIPGGDGGYGLGHAWATGGGATWLLYRNQWRESNGLYNLRARYYDPRQGRFISKDPYRPDEYNTVDRNGYGYAGGDPIGGWDPLGLADYRVGTGDPAIPSDPGAGPWGSKTPTLAMIIQKKNMMEALVGVWFVLPDAALNLRHYFQNTGYDYTINLNKMVKETPSAKLNYERELNEAKRFAGTLGEGHHEITSGRYSPGRNDQRENLNWFLAVGDYKYWGRATVDVKCDGSGNNRVNMKFEYKMRDRYNWDSGKSVTIRGITITDHYMGEFHRQGLAMEYDLYGSMTESYSWTVPVKSVEPLLPSPILDGGGRYA